MPFQKMSAEQREMMEAAQHALVEAQGLIAAGTSNGRRLSLVENAKLNALVTIARAQLCGVMMLEGGE